MDVNYHLVTDMICLLLSFAVRGAGVEDRVR